MLQTLYDQGNIQFDFDRQKWAFKIPEQDMLPANVVDLIVRGLQRLPPETQAVVKLAACIGSNIFTLFLLSIVYQRTLEETANDLWPALKAGLIVPTSNAYQIPLAFSTGLDLSRQVDRVHGPRHVQRLTPDKESDAMSNSAKMQSNVVVSYRILPP